MHFAFTEEQEQLRRTARRCLAACAGPARARAAMAGETGWDADAWRRVADELGWPALVIPERYGGAGLGWIELVAVMEEAGRAMLCSPFFATVCLGVNALAQAGSPEQQARWLPALAAGRQTATLACTGENGRWDAAVTDVVARPDAAGGHRISGTHAFVPDGHSADLLIVAARTPDGAPGLFVVRGDAPGLTRRSLSTLDRTRRLGEVRLREVHVTEADRLSGRTGPAVLERVLALAAIALAAEQLGGAERCLELAVAYAKTRVQFGRQIGSFQAIKHKCADLFVQVESARSAVYWAGWAAAVDAPDLPLAAATAKAWCSDAFYTCAAESLQIHGGIAFTWEHDAHLFLRRARAAQTLLGDAAYHRERLAQRILDDVGTRAEDAHGPAIL